MQIATQKEEILLSGEKAKILSESKKCRSPLTSISTSGKTKVKEEEYFGKITPKLSFQDFFDSPKIKKKLSFAVPLAERKSLRLLKEIKNKKFPPYKSTSRIVEEDLMINAFDCYKKEYEADDESNKENICKENLPEFYIIQKRRKFHSIRKHFESEIKFKSQTAPVFTKRFKIFRDDDIGITTEWQKYIKTSFEDNDTESESEFIKKSVKLCMKQLEEGIKLHIKYK